MKVELRQEIDESFRIWYRVYSDDKQMYGTTIKDTAIQIFKLIRDNKGEHPKAIILESVEVNTE